MKTYTGKTVDDAVSKACLDLGVTIDQLNYEVTLETKGLFSKKAEIACWTVEMVQGYIENLIRNSSLLIFYFINAAVCFCRNICTAQIQLGDFHCFEREIPSLQTAFLRLIYADASATGSTYVLQMIFQTISGIQYRC